MTIFFLYFIICAYAQASAQCISAQGKATQDNITKGNKMKQKYSYDIIYRQGSFVYYIYDESEKDTILKSIIARGYCKNKNRAIKNAESKIKKLQEKN